MPPPNPPTASQDDEEGPAEDVEEVDATRKEERKAMDALNDNRDGPEVDAAKVQAAFSSLQAQAKASRELAKKREVALASIKLADADVSLVMESADLTRPVAERALREVGGRVDAALDALARPDAAGLAAAKV